MNHETIPYLFSMGVAAMAQAMMYFSRLAQGEKFAWMECISCICVSAILGLIICMAAHSQGLGYELSGALSGMGGLLGKECVSFLKAIISKRLGVSE